MSKTTFRGEKNLGELISRIFPGLTPSKHKAAEAALLRLNPQLSAFDELQLGALLIVPNISPHKSKKQSEPDGTAASFVTTIAEALPQYRKHLEQVSKQVEEDEKKIIFVRLEWIKSTDEFKNNKNLQKAVDSVEEAATQRAKEAEKLREFATQGLKDAQDHLNYLLDRLR